ncbi:energy transducer TonB [Polaromonas sp. YR568]|uniref:energy transducer TonB n=1 Tax=Polaromonas sp. YR568 TaxID=1855301 RepID=UPI00398BE897
MMDVQAAGGPAQAVRPRALGLAADAAKTRAGQRMQFDIPAQPLQAALEAFGAVSGLSGFYGAEFTENRLSNAVSGLYTPDAALRLLIEHTGLDVHYTAVDAFILEPSASWAAATPATRDTGLDGLLQARVREAFCREPLLAAGDARIAISFRLGRQGRVEAPLLLDTTGDAGRDAAVLAALGSVDLGRVPEDAGSSFVMLILPQRAGAARECAPR